MNLKIKMMIMKILMKMVKIMTRRKMWMKVTILRMMIQ